MARNQSTMASRILQLSLLVGMTLLADASDQCDMFQGVDSLIQQCRTVKECPSGWRYNKQTKSCYLVVRESLTWADARGQCQNQGSDVASLNNKAEMGFVYDLVTEGDFQNFWIGLMREANNKWLWLDGTELAITNVGFWHPGEPNDYRGIEDGTVMYSSSLANDAPIIEDDVKNYVVCERKLYE